jgi:hypothetical protein
MELTWLFAGSVVALGVGYVVLQRAPQPGFVRWTLLSAALFALATRDLFQSRQRGRPAGGQVEGSTDRTDDGRRRTDERRRTPLFARLRRRVAGWLD